MASFSRASSVHDMHNVSETEDRNPRGKCWRCGRPEHVDKILADQCRLMTAILGQKWGSDSKVPTKNKKKAAFDTKKESCTTKETEGFKDGKSPKQKTPVFPLTTEAWGEEMDLLTRFSQHNLGFVPSTRPRLSKRTNKRPMLKPPPV